MKDKKGNSKIISIRKYLKKKEYLLKNKPTAKGEVENSSISHEEFGASSSNVIDLSSYLKTKGLDIKRQKLFLKESSEKTFGKVIPFLRREKDTLKEESDQVFSDLKEGESSIVFLENYFERKKFHNDFFERKSAGAKEVYSKSYKSMGWVAAALLALFSTSLFYNQSKIGSGRSLAGDGSYHTSISSEEVDRMPQSLNEESLSASEYVNYLNKNQHIIKVKGEKPVALDYKNY